MRDYLAHEVRNVTVLGHSGAGKTGVLEAMLYFTKASDRFGKTSEGSSLIDYDPEEIKRGITVYSTIVPMNGGIPKSISSIHRVIWISSVKRKAAWQPAIMR